MTMEKPDESQSKNPSDRSQVSRDEQILRTAIANSRLLIKAAAERGHAFGEDILSAIIESDDVFQRDALTSQQKVAFWHAYEQLSSMLHPITIESIRATNTLPPKRDGLVWSILAKINITYAQRCVFGYKILSTLTLLILIFLQVYWSIGSSLIRDIKTQTDEISSFEKQIRSLQTKQATEEKSLSTHHEVGELPTNTASKPAQKHLHRTVEGIALGGIDSKLEQLFSWREANFEQLTEWNSIWGSSFFIWKQPWQKASFQELPRESQLHIHYLAALYVLNAISGYFLPILYGLLGSTFYVLRQLPIEFDSMTFSINSQIDYGLRVTQGPLAGIMANFLFESDQSKAHTLITDNSLIGTSVTEVSTLSHFGPLVIAFLAGYSIELVFKAIDKIIATVTNKAPIAKMHTFVTSGNQVGQPISEGQKKQN